MAKNKHYFFYKAIAPPAVLAQDCLLPLVARV